MYECFLTGAVVEVVDVSFVFELKKQVLLSDIISVVGGNLVDDLLPIW